LVLGILFYWRVEGWSVLYSFYFCVNRFLGNPLIQAAV